MDKIWRKHRSTIILILCTIVAAVFIIYHGHLASEKKAAAAKETESYFATDKAESVQPPESGASSSTTGESATAGTNTTEIIIDIKGAIKKPGIYRLQPDDRVSDAIDQAGGFTRKADQDKINLAQKVKDEMVLYVPEKGEKPSEYPVTGSQQAGVAGGENSSGSTSEEPMVNINTADETGLQELPGIGPAKAQAILQYREQHGEFKTVDELTNVSGIGDKSLEKMKPSATVQ
ncbi:MAG: helix-hairpin-helix domain-containing protein [Sporolactobacillus sp.]